MIGDYPAGQAEACPTGSIGALSEAAGAEFRYAVLIPQAFLTKS